MFAVSYIAAEAFESNLALVFVQVQTCCSILEVAYGLTPWSPVALVLLPAVAGTGFERAVVLVAKVVVAVGFEKVVDKVTGRTVAAMDSRS